MISESDRQLVARDPAVPGLPLLLDEARLLVCLRELWPDQPLQSLECTYLRYKPGINCLAGYIAYTSGAALVFQAKARTVQHHSLVRPDETSWLLAEACIVLRRFPDDRELRGLSRLMRQESRPQLLRKILPEDPALWSALPELLRYKPGRRFVARLKGANGESAFVKLYDKGDFENARKGAVAFASREHLKIARQLGRSRRHRVIVSQWLNGRPLDEWLREPDFNPDRARDVGIALAELHRQTSNALIRPGREDAALSVLVAVNAAAWLHPALAERLQETALQVAAQLLSGPVMETTIHGDFNAEQVLWATDGVSIIDYDQACLGDPAADFGSFIARLEYEELTGLLPAGRIDGISTSLLDGYCSRARCDRPARIPIQIAASLLRLLPHPFRDRDRDWPGRMEGLLERAEQVLRAHPLDGGGGRPES